MVKHHGWHMAYTNSQYKSNINIYRKKGSRMAIIRTEMLQWSFDDRQRKSWGML